MQEDLSFNLIDEPWIPCISKKNTYEKKSLMELLRNTSDIKKVFHNNPLITISLHRFFACSFTQDSNGS